MRTIDNAGRDSGFVQHLKPYGKLEPSFAIIDKYAGNLSFQVRYDDSL